jgi:hypothetical protein
MHAITVEIVRSVPEGSRRVTCAELAREEAACLAISGVEIRFARQMAANSLQAG